MNKIRQKKVKVLKTQKKVKLEANELLDKFYKLINKIPQKGNTSSECQKINILHQIQQLEYTINGLCIKDFILNI